MRTSMIFKNYKTAEVRKWAIGKWCAINQRTINGAYSHEGSVAPNRQQASYIAKGVRIDMTFDEWHSYCFSHEQEILAMLKAGQRPSVDRLDETKGYQLDNIQVIPLISNMRKGRETTDYTATDPIIRQIANRTIYRTSHAGLVYQPRVIDHYMDLYGTVRYGVNIQLADMIKAGLIKNPFNYASKKSVYSLEAEKTIAAYVADVEQKAKDELTKKEEKVVASHIKCQLIASKMRAAEVKAMPEYEPIYRWLTARRSALMAGRIVAATAIDERLLTGTAKPIALELTAAGIDPRPATPAKRAAQHVIPTHKNISWDSGSSMYVVSFTKNKIKYYIGRFKSENDAVNALEEAKIAAGVLI